MATVSRVLNEDWRVAPDTRERVLAAIGELHYAPNVLGRNLRKNSTRRVLVLMPHISNTFFSGVIRGAEHVAWREKYQVMISLTHGKPQLERDYIRLLYQKSIDGILLLSSRLPPEELDELAGQYPIVSCSETIEGAHLPYVGIDNFCAARDVAEYLFSQGHERIGFLGRGKSCSARQREAGFRAAFAKNHRQLGEKYLIPGDFNFASGVMGCKRLLSLPQPPTAIFAIADIIAAGAMRQLYEMGRVPGKDIAVFGFDDADISRMLTPRLSTVSQSKSLLGRTAMRLLLDRIEDPKARFRDIILEHKLVLRESTHILPVETAQQQ